VSLSRAALNRFLGTAFPGARVEPLAGDASTRRFYRLHTRGGRTLVVMDYGESFGGETDDVRATRLFRTAGLAVPEIVTVAGDPGCLVLEDLGDRTLERAQLQASPAERRRLYDAAIDLAVDVAVAGTRELERDAGDWPALDADRFRFEMDFFVEHYVGGLMGDPTCPPGLSAALHLLAERAAAGPRRVLCHRDYHSRNLMVRVDGSLAMVDVQDARWGPDTYDLASLLCDPYVDLAASEVERGVERYRAALVAPPAPDDLRARFDIVAAQRLLKALGTFGFQSARLGRAHYLSAVPRAVARLRRLLPSRPETAPVGRMLEEAGLLRTHEPNSN
jgi:aminoglycoside/choline kinase family phosphotransferase